MGKIVVFQKNATDYLNHLIEVLFNLQYFTFEESAQQYVSNIFDFIENELPYSSHRQTPKKLKNHGSKYAIYQSNKRTTWYIFFENQDNRYLITYIMNNHMSKAGDL